MNKNKNRYKRIVAQLLLSIFLFENCTQLNLTPSSADPQLGSEEAVSHDKTENEKVKLEVKQADDWEMETISHAKTARNIGDINLANLNAAVGFQINGANADGQSGWSVSQAGDINNDSIDDIIIGVPQADPNGNTNAGSGYVIYGKQGGYNAAVDLSGLTSTVGFRINGATGDGLLGSSVSQAGDVNNDGIDDVIIGAPLVAPNSIRQAGSSYVIYGKQGGYNADIELSSLTSTDGFQINGADEVNKSGSSVSQAGDVNNDGIDDVIIGAPGATSNGNSNAGSSYVIYGKQGGYNADIELSSLSSTDGFQINGANANDQSGSSVSQAGDVNNDGIDDIIIGAPQADPNGNNNAGSSYVIYGKQGGYPAAIELSSLSSTDGFRINGAAVNDVSGYSVSQAGDVNNDGIDDVIIGAPLASPNGKTWAGTSYVIYGKQGGYNADIELSSLSSTNGFQINGAATSDGIGYSVSQADDVNNDGIDDVIIGAPSDAGTSYVIYGKQGGYNAAIDLASRFASTVGFQINGAAAGDLSGSSVSQAGDVNNDGIDDVIIGAPGAGPNNNAGASYVIYGSVSSTSSSPASNLRPSWFLPKGWYESLKSLWFQPEVTVTISPEAEALTKLHYKCGRMIKEADSKTVDKWYSYSLEDLQEDITEVLKNPEEITKKTIRHFNHRLDGIEKDFLREPLLEKPSFFAAPSHHEMPLRHEGSIYELLPISIPLLGSGYVPPVIGN